MAELSYTEQTIVEEMLEMSGGYVLDFSDRTFRDFVGNTGHFSKSDNLFRVYADS